MQSSREKNRRCYIQYAKDPCRVSVSMQLLRQYVCDFVRR